LKMKQLQLNDQPLGDVGRNKSPQSKYVSDQFTV
jgi:hypothetical protein